MQHEPTHGNPLKRFEDGAMEFLWAGLRHRVTLLLALFRPAPIAPARPAAAPHPWEKSYPEGLDWDMAIPIKPVPAILDAAVTAWPDSPCLEFLGKRYNYAEVGELVARAAKGFQELGVTKDVPVGLFLPNSAYYVICYYAVLKAAQRNSIAREPLEEVRRRRDGISLGGPETPGNAAAGLVSAGADCARAPCGRAPSLGEVLSRGARLGYGDSNQAGASYSGCGGDRLAG